MLGYVQSVLKSFNNNQQSVKIRKYSYIVTVLTQNGIREHFIARLVIYLSTHQTMIKMDSDSFFYRIQFKRFGK